MQANCSYYVGGLNFLFEYPPFVRPIPSRRFTPAAEGVTADCMGPVGTWIVEGVILTTAAAAATVGLVCGTGFVNVGFGAGRTTLGFVLVIRLVDKGLVEYGLMVGFEDGLVETVVNLPGMI